MKPTVYYGSIMHGQAVPEASLETKYYRMMDLLDFSTIKKRDKVAVKMHLGFQDGFQTVPVFYVRRLVQRLKELGAYPFITDNPTSVYNAAERGYTQETCGCPIIPISGVKDGYGYPTEIGYRGVDEMRMVGALYDADALINLSHVKGHCLCGHGGAFKNLALGGYCGTDRWFKIHRIFNSVQWQNPEKLTREHAQKLIDACPTKVLKWDEKKEQLKLSWDLCLNGNCLECVKADEGVGALSLGPQSFSVFSELMSVAAGKVLETFDDDKLFHLGFMLDITPQCDCLGVAQPIVVPDLGIVGSRDIVASEEAALDIIKQQGLIESMIPPYIRRVNLNPEADLHPFQRIWGPWKDPYLVCRYGEELGLGSRSYTLEEILPPEETLGLTARHSLHEDQPTFF